MVSALSPVAVTNGNFLAPGPEQHRSSSWTYLCFLNPTDRQQALQKMLDQRLTLVWGLDTASVSLHRGMPPSCNYCGAVKLNGSKTCLLNCKKKGPSLRPMEAETEGTSQTVFGEPVAQGTGSQDIPMTPPQPATPSAATPTSNPSPSS